MSFLGASCAGDPFFYAPPEAQGLGDTSQLVTSQGGAVQDVPSPSTVTVEPAPVPAPTGSPCGVLRVGSSVREDGEVCIDESQFTMGQTEGDPVGDFSHGPERETILSAFAIGEYEVTVIRYRDCVEGGACEIPKEGISLGCTYSEFPGSADLLPITCVTHAQARAFCAWDTMGGSLPTEAQWERVARGVSSRIYPWGDEISCSLAVVGGNSQCAQHGGTIPKPVGSVPSGASVEGIYDLIGNASEWVADWAGSYGSQPTVQNPQGPDSGVYRLYRGGSWTTPLPLSASFLRWATSPESTSPLSFRCARPGTP